MKKVSFLAVLALLFSCVASAQLSTQATANVTVQVTQQNSISLVEASGGNFTFDNTTGASNSIVLSANWTLDNTFTHVNLYGYFPTTTALTTTGGSQIPASAVASTWTVSNGASSGTAMPCNGNSVTAGGSCQAMLLASATGGTLSLNPQTVTATFSLSLPNYAGLKLSAGNFTGTISFVVSAT